MILDGDHGKAHGSAWCRRAHIQGVLKMGKDRLEVVDRLIGGQLEGVGLGRR